jgi:predicted TIM-barrel fold metal-dependent hydrolase
MPTKTFSIPEIIDFHVHLCRSVAEEKLVFPRAGWPDAWYWATPERVVPYMDTWNVSHVVTLNIMDTGAMTRARLRKSGDSSQAALEGLREEMRARVRRFNDWACEVHSGQTRIVPFIMADPVLFGDEVAAEVERCLAQGAKGVKVHPGICGHFPDDKRALPIYEVCSSRDIPVLTDTSGKASSGGDFFGAPSNWRGVLKNFSNLRIVLAHLCGERWDEQIALAEEFKENLFFDMSGGFVDDHHPVASHRAMLLQEGSRVFRVIGTDRILFGSDGPAGRREIPDAVSQLLQLGLSDDENTRILRTNAAELLSLGQ